MMSYDDSISNMCASVFFIFSISILGLGAILVENWANSKNIFDTGFSIDRILDWYRIDFWIWPQYCILKMAIFNKIDYIDIEPALGFGYWSFRYLGCWFMLLGYFV